MAGGGLVVVLMLQLGAAGDKLSQDITVSSNESVTGEYYNIGAFRINSGVTVTATGITTIRARVIIIDGTLTADAGNTSETAGAGGNGSGGTDAGGGAGHAGTGGGGTGTGTSGSPYTTTSTVSVTVLNEPDSADDLGATPDMVTARQGSNGGTGAGGSVSGGTGGGVIVLISEQSISVAGIVSTNGSAGSNGSGNSGGGGGGSGGGVVIAAPTVTVSGTVRANGGSGGNGSGTGANGGGGSGGFVKIYYDSIAETGTVTASAGSGGSGGSGGGGGNGSAGTVSRTRINFRPKNTLTLSINDAVTVGGTMYIGSSSVTLALAGFSDWNSADAGNFTTHAATQWQLRTESGSYSSAILDTGFSSASINSRAVAGLGEGRYYFRVKVVDAGTSAGYAGTTAAPSSSDRELESIFSSETTFIIDLTAPSAPPLSSPVNSNIGSNSTVLRWGAAGDSLSGVKHYRVVVINSATNETVVDTTTTATSLAVSNLPDVVLVWKVAAVDNAGNQSAFSESKFITFFGAEGSSKCSLAAAPPAAGSRGGVAALAIAAALAVMYSARKAICR